MTIDESIIPFEGRFSEMRYGPGKTHDRGIKVYKLARPSGYVLKTIINLDKDTIYNDTGIDNLEAFKEGKWFI